MKPKASAILRVTSSPVTNGKSKTTVAVKAKRMKKHVISKHAATVAAVAAGDATHLGKDTSGDTEMYDGDSERVFEEEGREWKTGDGVEVLLVVDGDCGYVSRDETLPQHACRHGCRLESCRRIVAENLDLAGRHGAKNGDIRGDNDDKEKGRGERQISGGTPCVWMALSSFERDVVAYLLCHAEISFSSQTMATRVLVTGTPESRVPPWVS